MNVQDSTLKQDTQVDLVLGKMKALCDRARIDLDLILLSVSY